MEVYQDSSVKLLHEDTPISIRSVRISVSTPDFHSGKMSSTLIQTTKSIISIDIIINYLIKIIMAKSKQTVNEVQLKARRTSLGKKTNDELITIILRKDKSERSMNTKIQELTALLKEADSLNEDKANAIIELNKTIESQKDKINTIIERNDNLLINKNNADKEVVRLKDKCNVLQKVVWTCFGVIVILGISLFIF